MLNELEDFLKRAAQRALEAQQKQLPRQQPVQRPAPVTNPGARPTPARLVPQRIEPQVEVVEAELLEQPNRVSDSVQQHLRSTQQIGQHASQLGDRVSAGDAGMQAHLHKSFDHKLGRLTQSGGNTLPDALPENTDTYAASSLLAMHPIAQLLANPLSIRNAIMLREILDRPTDRWE